MTLAPDQRDFRRLKALGLYAQRTLEMPLSLTACLDSLQNLPPPPRSWYESELVNQTDRRGDLLIRWLSNNKSVIEYNALIFCTVTAVGDKTHLNLEAYPGASNWFWAIMGVLFSPALVIFIHINGQILFNGALVQPVFICFWGLALMLAWILPASIYFIATQHRHALKLLIDYLQKPDTPKGD